MLIKLQKLWVGLIAILWVACFVGLLFSGGLAQTAAAMVWRGGFVVGQLAKLLAKFEGRYHRAAFSLALVSSYTMLVGIMLFFIGSAEYDFLKLFFHSILLVDIIFLVVRLAWARPSAIPQR